MGESTRVSSGPSWTARPSAGTVEKREMITCPRCGFEQRDSLECIRCGVIFSKFVHRQENDARHGPAGRPYFITHQDTSSQKSRVGMLLLLLTVVAFGAYRFWMSLDLRHPAGILVSSVPNQINLKDPRPWRKDNRVFVPLARFSLRARVLSKERYRFDRTSDISPVDLVLGWGPMSDQGILDNLDIFQGSRRFVMAPLSPAPPLSLFLLMEYCANMHMIPADTETGDLLKGVRAGEIIELAGYLVGIQEGGQWVWVSSLSRKDTGDGSCEIIWVEQVRVLTDVGPSTDITQLDSRRFLAQK